MYNKIIMIRLTSLSKEAYRPPTDFIYELLDKNKSKILSCKSNEEVSDILTDIFHKYYIIFLPTGIPSEECLDEKWLLAGAYTTNLEKSLIGSGIAVKLGKGFIENLKLIGPLNWVSFKNTLESLIGHELIHMYQILRIPKSKLDSVFAGKEDPKEYLSQPHEIQAFAYQTVREFKDNGYSDEQILKRIRNPYTKTKKIGSKTFRTYIHFFKSGDPIIKKFLSVIYKYLKL